MMTASGQQTRQEAFSEEVFSGDGAISRRLRLQVERIAPHFRSTLLVGEAGVGKRTVAEELHRLSPASGEKFVAMLAEEVSEAPEWGVGTVYLWGLERLNVGGQVELARRLDCPERHFRLVLGSACEPRGMIAAGRMCAQLADAMEMPTIRVAALRERVGEIEEIAAAMLRRVGSGASFAPAALHALRSYGWPGNLAEMWQVCEQVAGQAWGPGAVIEAEELPLLGCAQGDAALRLDEVIARHVRDVLQRCAGNKLKAAALLGISRSTLYRMLEA